MPQLDYKPKCPCCNNTLDGYQRMNGQRPPTKGDITICLYCHSALQIQEDLSFKKLSEADLHVMSILQPNMHQDIMAAINVTKHILEHKQRNLN